jgi:prevent-host-death family protein
MLKTISSSDLRAQIKRVLNEVGYGQSQYIVERFGDPIAAIISVEDLRLLQTAKQRRSAAMLRELVADLRARGSTVGPDGLQALIEEARTEFYSLQGSPSDGD